MEGRENIWHFSVIDILVRVKAKGGKGGGDERKGGREERDGGKEGEEREGGKEGEEREGVWM